MIEKLPRRGWALLIAINRIDDRTLHAIRLSVVVADPEPEILSILRLQQRHDPEVEALLHDIQHEIQQRRRRHIAPGTLRIIEDIQALSKEVPVVDDILSFRQRHEQITTVLRQR